jgi:hypothetical protein
MLGATGGGSGNVGLSHAPIDANVITAKAIDVTIDANERDAGRRAIATLVARAAPADPFVDPA